jgi:hypothetical protein
MYVFSHVTILLRRVMAYRQSAKSREKKKKISDKKTLKMKGATAN